MFKSHTNCDEVQSYLGVGRNASFRLLVLEIRMGNMHKYNDINRQLTQTLTSSVDIHKARI